MQTKKPYHNNRWNSEYQKLLELHINLPTSHIAKLLDYSEASIFKRKKAYFEKLKEVENEDKRQRAMWGYTNENIHSIAARADEIIAQFEKKKKII